MYCSNARSFGELREYLDRIPVIETHEHYTKYQKAEDPLDFIIGNYYMSDFQSAGGEGWFDGGARGEERERERFEEFLKYYHKSDKTAYARGMQQGLRQVWGVEKIDCFEDYKAFADKLKSRDETVYERTMDELNIKAKVVDIFDLADYVEGKTTHSKYCRFAFSLPFFHDVHSKNDLLRLQKHLDRPVTTLDDYLECFENYLSKCVDFGVVCFKDQTAYRRSIAYGNPSRADAEKIFDEMIYSPRDIFGDDRVRALDDFLFQYAMRAAAKRGLPVQIHTGHMAGIRNDIVKTNAAGLIPVLELHQNVNFSLFHGNWPYMDEYLYIGKNFPNAYLDLCWVQVIDPLYCVELMKRAVMTVPHSKLFAFGGDTGMVEWVAGYLHIAKDNVAIALSELTDSGWLDMGEAKQIAVDWFFNNPNAFYKLGL